MDRRQFFGESVSGTIIRLVLLSIVVGIVFSALGINLFNIVERLQQRLFVEGDRHSVEWSEPLDDPVALAVEENTLDLPQGPEAVWTFIRHLEPSLTELSSRNCSTENGSKPRTTDSRSRPPSEASKNPTGVIASQSPSGFARKLTSAAPLVTSQTLVVPSLLPDSTCRPSG